MVHDSLHDHGIGHECRHAQQIILANFYCLSDPAMALSLLAQSDAFHGIGESLGRFATLFNPGQGMSRQPDAALKARTSIRTIAHAVFALVTDRRNELGLYGLFIRCSGSDYRGSCKNVGISAR